MTYTFKRSQLIFGMGICLHFIFVGYQTDEKLYIDVMENNMASIVQKLKIYRSKRNPKRTPEPFGPSRKRGKRPIFVIQKHSASHLHYDVRLEIDGVLASWAVPKGPSLNPTIKRLAVPTEDHPMEYAKFEGTIPKGSYGGGTVMVWDYGIFKNLKKEDGKEVPLSTCYKQGRIEVFLRGKKLKGGFALIKLSGRKDWLLIKMNDEYASKKKNPVTQDTRSAKTGRTMDEIATLKRGKVWQ